VANTQWQINSSRSTAAHSQGQIHRGGYTAVDIQWQKQWQIYNTAHTVADTRQQIHSSGYTVVDEQQQIQ
jgi:hypothetical protein